MENSNPRIFEKTTLRPIVISEEDDAVYDQIDSREVFGEYNNNSKQKFYNNYCTCFT